MSPVLLRCGGDMSAGWFENSTRGSLTMTFRTSHSQAWRYLGQVMEVTKLWQLEHTEQQLSCSWSDAHFKREEWVGLGTFMAGLGWAKEGDGLVLQWTVQCVMCIPLSMWIKDLCANCIPLKPLWTGMNFTLSDPWRCVNTYLPFFKHLFL